MTLVPASDMTVGDVSAVIASGGEKLLLPVGEKRRGFYQVSLQRRLSSDSFASMWLGVLFTRIDWLFNGHGWTWLPG